MKTVICFSAAILCGAILWGSETVAGPQTPGSFAVLHRFETIEPNGITFTYDGTFPQGGLIQATDGNFYGMTQTGGSGGCTDDIGIVTGCGAVFRVSVDASTGAATETVVYSFKNDGNDGAYPDASLIQGADGNLYGTTRTGGTGACNGGCGTVFRISIDPKTGLATEKVLYSFQNIAQDGGYPYAGLIQGRDGSFYGTTVYGGSGSCWFPLTPNGCGTVFRISIDPKTGMATEKVLHSFQDDSRDGKFPAASLIQGNDGNFYGTTIEGGSGGCSFGASYYGCGTVFRISVNPATGGATETILYSFGRATNDGAFPRGSLIQDSKGDFYGTTSVGGNSNALVGSIGGTAFRISVAPITGVVTEKVIYAFKDSPDGSYPTAGLLLGHDGNLYGTTQLGGSAGCGCGTVYRLSVDAATGTVSETLLHSLGQPDGIWPLATLVQGKDGSLYGTTSGFSLNPPATGGVFRVVP